MAKIYGPLENAQIETLSSNPGALIGRIWHNSTDGKSYISDGTLLAAVLQNDGNLIVGTSGTAADNVRVHRGGVATLQAVLATDATAEGTLSTNMAILDSKLPSFTNGTRPAFGNTGRKIWNTTDSAVQVDTGAAWQELSAAVEPNVESISGTDTLDSGNDIVLASASGGAFTLNLPTAAGITGKIYTIKKTDSTFNAVTLDGSGAETIDGSTTTTLDTENEIIKIVSDGTNWEILDRKTDTAWASYTPTISAGLGTVSNVNFFWRRVASNIEITGHFQTGTVAASASNLTMPSGIDVDTGVIVSSSRRQSVGHWNVALSGAPSELASSPAREGPMISKSDTTNTLHFCSVISFGEFQATNGTTMANNSAFVTINVSVPVDGWNS